MIENLLRDASFISAGSADELVPADFGIYAIRLRQGSDLPGIYGVELTQRSTRVIYIGQAEKSTLRARFLKNELRAEGHGTFFRSLGAVLGYRPVAGSLAGYARQQNYVFAPTDRDSIVEWINANLEVSWITLPQAEVHSAEVKLIREHTPLLNLQDNPRRMPELAALRKLCRDVAGGHA